MVETCITVTNKTGLHARPASLLVKLAKSFPCKITVQNAERTGNCKSIVSVLTCNVVQGSSITLRAEGEGETEALEQLAALINSFEE